MTAKDIDDPEFFLPSEFLSDDFYAESKGIHEENPTASIVMDSSPQSTLNGIGSWSFSSNDSPDAPSTPLITPSKDPSELLNAASGRVERLSLENNIHQQTDAIRIQELNQQLRAIKFYHMKQLQLVMLQQQYANAVSERERKGIPVRKNGLSLSEWPPLEKPQKKQSVNRVVPTAITLNGVMRQPTGTGVFLPRHSKVQSLEPGRRHDALNCERSHGRRNHSAAGSVSNPEILKLPQEWTY